MMRRIAWTTAGLLTFSEASARPLDPEACGKLRAEITALDDKGVKALLEKGPAAAKGTTTKEQIADLRVYFDKLGNFRFRCPQDAPLVVLKPEPVEDPNEAAAAATAPIDAGTPGITLPPGVAAATVGPVAPSAPRQPATPKKPAPKAAAAPPAAAPAASPADPAAPAAKKPPPAAKTVAPAAAAPEGSAAPKPAAKPKPKADDAFRPAAPAAATPPAASEAPAKTAPKSPPKSP